MKFIATFVAAFFALVVFNLITTHVEKVENVGIADCLSHTCVQINDAVYTVK